MSAIQNAIHTTRFYPAGFPIPGSADESSATIQAPSQMSQMHGDVGTVGTLPALWWLGIVIVLVALRLAYEYS